MFNFYFIVNGPGEISGWLYPIIKFVKEEKPLWIKDINFYAVLVPCQFATGEEERILKNFEFFKEIFPARNYWRNFYKKPRGNNIIFHIGGDVFFNGVLGKMWNAFSIAYVEKKYPWLFLFDLVYYSKNIGDLRFENLNRKAFSRESNNIALFPGSRDYALRFYLPFYVALIRELIKTNKNLKFTIFFSPFLKEELIKEYLRRLNPLMRDLPLEIKSLKDWKEDVEDFLFAITLPGTTTIQLGYSGIPMLVLLPLHRPEYLPLEGLGHYIKGRFRNYLVELYLRRNPFVSLPNRYKPGIVPEIVGRFDFKKVVKYTLEILEKREEIEKAHKELLTIFPEINRSPSQIIWDGIYEVLEKNS